MLGYLDDNQLNSFIKKDSLNCKIVTDDLIDKLINKELSSKLSNKELNGQLNIGNIESVKEASDIIYKDNYNYGVDNVQDA